VQQWNWRELKLCLRVILLIDQNILYDEIIIYVFNVILKVIFMQPQLSKLKQLKQK
jgi:hypothetical protein